MRQRDDKIIKTIGIGGRGRRNRERNGDMDGGWVRGLLGECEGERYFKGKEIMVIFTYLM